jgi:hypothetical protein
LVQRRKKFPQLERIKAEIMRNSIALLVCLGAGLAVAPALRATTTFNYATGNQGQGSGANSITLTSNGVTTTATAWGMTGNSNTTFQWATLGQYSGLGLGVCNQQEINCGAPQHEVDDNGQLDFVRFHFSSPVDSLSITVTPVCNCDTNASYITGNNISLMGETLAQVGTFSTSTEASKDTARTITLSNLGGVNTLVFGAALSGNNNYFKIESLSVTGSSAAPEPATLALVGIAFVIISMIGRKRRNS